MSASLLKRIPWLVALGSATLFAAFIAQNYFEGQWTQERGRLEFFNVLLSLEEIKATQWRLALRTEQRRSPQETADLIEAASFYAQHSAVVTSLAELRAGGSAAGTPGHYQAQVALTTSIHDAAEHGDMAALNRHIAALEAFNAQHAPQLMQQATQRYATVVALEEQWSNRFLWLYIFGTVLAAAGVLRSWLRPADAREGSPNPGLKRTETALSRGPAA
jgi:hypothetical protein